MNRPNRGRITIPEDAPKGKMQVSLDQILATTRSGLADLAGRSDTLAREASAAPQPPSLEAALKRPTVAVVAEVKRRSPSAGVICNDLDPAERAALYAARGAAAISVLTDAPFFGGSVGDLRSAAARVPVPVLRKDFILDELQIVEARAAGAAAVLLIVRALPRERLAALLGAAAGQGLDALVEIHTAAEQDAALDAEARIIGVNSRDLDTFRIDTDSAWELLRRVPADRVAVAESGMTSLDDVVRARDRGADAVLIGSALSAAPDPGAVLDQLSAVPRRGR
jgi:indole-3-glycerol phosphate synthase